ncbi:MAG: hypothetical protein ACE5O2_03055 [Armatimonadota bacterium]
MRLYVLIAFVIVAGLFGWLGYVNRDATPVYVTQLDPENPDTTGVHIEVPVFVLIVVSVLAGVLLAAAFYALPGFRDRDELARRLQAQLKKTRAQLREKEQAIAERDGQIRALREKAGLAAEREDVSEGEAEAKDVEIELGEEAEAQEGRQGDAEAEKQQAGSAEAKESVEEETVEARDDEEPI